MLPDFLKAHYKKVLFVALPVVAFFSGRFFGPERVEIRTEEKIVTKIEVVEKIVVQKEEAKERTKIVYREKIVYKDGTVVERESEREAEKSDTKTKTETETETKSETTKVVVVSEKKVTLRPDWRISARFGVDISQAIKAQPQWIVGVQLDRRIIGGFSAGVWAHKQLTPDPLAGWSAGLGLSVEF